MIGIHRTTRPGPAPGIRPIGAGPLVAGVLLAGSLLAAGCGLPEDAAPHPIDDVPSDLLEAPTSETTVSGVGREELNLYFFEDLENLLVRVERATETEPTLQDALDAVAAQPTQEEITELQVSTRLPEDLAPAVGELTNGNLQIRVADGSALRNSFDPEQVRRVYTQVVCTLTDLDPDLLGIQLMDGSGMIQVSTVEGALIDQRPVTREDVGGCTTRADLEAAATTTTTPTTINDGIPGVD